MKKELLITSLIERSWYHEENFVSNLYCQELIKEIENFKLKPAKIGKGAGQQLNHAIRNDAIFWIEPENTSPLHDVYLNKISELMTSLNHELYLGLKQFESHFAHYQAGGFYKKHLDQHANNKERLVSLILYLNSPTEGGELIIYSQTDPNIIEAKITPKPGTLVCFLSNKIYHEVCPTESDRYTWTGWLRTTIL